MGIKHATQFTGPKLNSDDWNEAHDIADDTITAAHLVDTYAKYTAGQTFNVSTSAELQTVIDSLTAAPSIFGDIVILAAAGTYDDDITIPELVYDGFTVTIRGTLTSIATLISNNAGIDTVYTTGSMAFGTVDDTGLSVNLYADKLLKNSSGEYAPIHSNTTTTINHNQRAEHFTKVGAAETYYVEDWGTIFTGKISNGDRSYINFEDCHINNSDASHYNNFMHEKSSVSYDNCKLEKTTAFFNTWADPQASILMSGCLVISNAAYFRMSAINQIKNYLTERSSMLKNGTGAAIETSNGNSLLIYCVFDASTAPAGSIGVSANNVSYAQPIFCWFRNQEIGVKSTFLSLVNTVATNDYTGCTTDQSPAAAGVPSYST